jgi:NAD(P)-dependent dehydrogenase (short-subunit alcohol dehydrogenase family)
MMDFENRTVVVTGAGGNLGSAVAHAFEARGARLALLDLDRDILGKAFGAEDDNRLLLPVDLLDRDRVNAAVGTIIDQFGRIDVLCNIAGGFRMGEPVHETSDLAWDFLMDINARSLIHATGAVVPHMLNAMSAELRERGINVNCVLPTIIDTPENRSAMPKADPRRWVAPADLAAVILFLSSDAARAVHGAAIPVAGLS